MERNRKPLRFLAVALAALATLALFAAGGSARAATVSVETKAQANATLTGVWNNPDNGVIVALIKFALAGGADVDAKDDRGLTPLTEAALRGSLGCVHLLVANGADVNAADRLGEPVVDYAINGGSVDCVRYLVSKGSDVNAADDDGKTPLMYAIMSDSNRADRMLCASILIAGGANVNAKDKQGKSALDLAASDAALVTLLKAQGAKSAGG